MSGTLDAERVQAVVIGGGQAGLSVGYHLARRGLSFVILEANARIGDSWRARWDSLRLFTPARFDAIPEMRFNAPANDFPTKNQMADYLESYATRFELPVRTGATVDRVWREGDRYFMRAGARTFEADHVWSRCPTTRSRAFQRSRGSSIRTSCRCTRSSIGARRSCATAGCCSSARETPAPRSRSSPGAPDTRRGCPDATPARYPSVWEDSRDGLSSRASCCGSSFIAC